MVRPSHVICCSKAIGALVPLGSGHTRCVHLLNHVSLSSSGVVCPFLPPGPYTGFREDGLGSNSCCCCFFKSSQ